MSDVTRLVIESGIVEIENFSSEKAHVILQTKCLSAPERDDTRFDLSDDDALALYSTLEAYLKARGRL